MYNIVSKAGLQMFKKFDHKFKGKKGYNFLIIFTGLLFATFLILPDSWRTIKSFLLAIPTTLLIAYLSSRNTEQQQDSKD